MLSQFSRRGGGTFGIARDNVCNDLLQPDIALLMSRMGDILSGKGISNSRAQEESESTLARKVGAGRSLIWHD